MKPPAETSSLVSSDVNAIANLHRFSHEAMSTTFEIFIVHPEARYAQQAAYAAFNEVDALEAELSRFIENSDINRINNLAAGQLLQVSMVTFECLQIAAKMYDQTNGAFDVTVGSGMFLVELNEDEYTVKMTVDGVKIDMGGIGKGYAVDKMALLLGEWDIDIALIHGGYSSVLALDAPAGGNGWAITFSEPVDKQQTIAKLSVKNRAIGASGLVKGEHIIDPRTSKPVQGKIAAWTIASDAAMADALSTAFMVMRPEQINQYCKSHGGVSAMIITDGPEATTTNKKICHYGQWENL